jgi:hypothetical protein
MTAQAFNYNLIKACIAIVAALLGGPIVHRERWRPILIVGCAFQAIFYPSWGGIGGHMNATKDALRVMVPSIMLSKVAVVRIASGKVPWQ